MNEPHRCWTETSPKSPLWTRFLSRVVFPVQERFQGRDSVARLGALERSQWWPPPQFERSRLARLKQLLVYARRHVPYYRSAFTNIGFDPEAMTSLGDLERLPFLTGELIRANDLKSAVAESLKRCETEISGGGPLVFFIGRERRSHDVAARWRAIRWWRLDIGDPAVVVAPVSIDPGAHRIRDKLLRIKPLPGLGMSPAELGGLVREIRAFRPRMICGCTSALVQIVCYAEASGQRLNDLGICVAFVSLEPLDDVQRDQISAAFDCAVVNSYHRRDAGFIAHECNYGGMHVNGEDIVIEIIDDDGHVLPAGKSGEIVVTNMATREFPFIRYRTGDMGMVDNDECECGRSLPLLKELLLSQALHMVAAKPRRFGGGR